MVMMMVEGSLQPVSSTCCLCMPYQTVPCHAPICSAGSPTSLGCIHCWQNSALLGLSRHTTTKCDFRHSGDFQVTRLQHCLLPVDTCLPLPSINHTATAHRLQLFLYPLSEPSSASQQSSLPEALLLGGKSIPGHGSNETRKATSQLTEAALTPIAHHGRLRRVRKLHWSSLGL